MAQTILIVEDEVKLAEVLSKYLQLDGFNTHILSDGATVIDWVEQQQPDLVLLDLMLPNVDGLELSHDIREFSIIPIIMVTARVEEIDRLIGLEAGADDYVCKPYSPKEVVARVKAQLRRCQFMQSAASAVPTSSAPIRLDKQAYKGFIQGVDLHLTVVEFNLLSILLSEPGRIFSRDILMTHLYDDGRIVSERTIDSHIKKLRKKLSQEAEGQEFIRSVYSAGYAFELQ